MDNAILNIESDVPARIAQRTLAKRGADYASEVRRLLDAALELMRQGGTATRPRVADIVAAAGLSNEAFYRHFRSKDALVAALLEDGTERLARYVAHQMGKEPSPEGKVRRWVEGVLSQTRDEIAATTLAVLWNAGGIGESFASSRHVASVPLGELLREPFARLGSADPAMDASLAAHATVGMMADYLWRRATPTPAEVDRITEFCLRAAAGPAAPAAPAALPGRSAAGAEPGD
jgi:AcrR family transcriptional regulator